MENMNKGEKLEIFNMVKKKLGEGKDLDLFQKGFLKPTEICLKTKITENDPDKPFNSLPYGLKQVHKKQIALDKYTLHNFPSFRQLKSDQLNFEYIEKNHYDNMISLLKNEKNLQVAICICMYSQEKQMLNRTLSGVRQNVSHFVKNGVRGDDIVVCLVIDGIQTVDQSMLGFFQQMQKQNNIYLSQDEETLSTKELLEDDFEEFEIKNLNSFIFNQEQFLQRKSRRFQERYREYINMQRLMKRIQELEKSKFISFQMLEPLMQNIFVKLAQERRKKQYAEDDEDLKKLNKQFFIKEYGNNKPLLWETIIQTKRFCEKYFRSRQNFALLNCYRLQVPIIIEEDQRPLLQEQGSLRNIHEQPYRQRETKSTKMNLLVITKYRNSGKLSSHNWFFNGLCQEIKFNYTVLLDVGLCPERKSLYRMYKCMRDDMKVGGVCGYMGIRIERVEEEEQVNPESLDFVSNLVLKCFDIQRAQQIEYHLSHLVDKPFQATFNFIHVLPGAFSGYKMEALYGPNGTDSDLLKNYFKSLDDSVSRSQLQIEEISACHAVLKVLLPDFMYNCCFKHTVEGKRTDWQVLQESNVHLAEDRTLCMGIHENGYNLKYIPNATAWVDPMKTLHGLFGQRKRWINGSYFAFEMVKKEIAKGEGNCCLYPQLAVLELLNSLAFISPALFLFTISIAMNTIQVQLVNFIVSGVLNQGTGTDATNSVSQLFTQTINFIYVLLLLGLVFYSMHMNTKNSRFLSYIYCTSSIFGILAIIVFVVLLVDLIRGLGSGASFLVQEIANQPQNLIPGGKTTIDSLRYVIIGSMCFYVLPIVVFAIGYKRCSFIAEMILGIFSFIFYSPTYLNILSTYALCRIDDFSWGTKGLTSENNLKNQQIKAAWKTIKVIYVAKFIFWNAVAGAIFVSLSSSYVTRFFFTYVFLTLIALFLIIKIVIGTIYLIKQSCAEYGPINGITYDDSLDQLFERVKPSLLLTVQGIVLQLQKNEKFRKRFIKIIGESKEKKQDKYRKSR